MDDGAIRQSVEKMDELLNKLRMEIDNSFTIEELLSAIQSEIL